MKFYVLIFMTIFLIGCSDSEPGKSPVTNTVKVNAAKRHLDLSSVQHGQQLFLQNCAQCHGKQAEAKPDWKKTGADGKYPPPPLNGTAHAWHHSQSVLHKVIKNGTLHLGGSMPAWKGKLTDKEIDDIIVWIKAIWPDKVYQAWQSRNGPSS